MAYKPPHANVYEGLRNNLFREPTKKYTALTELPQLAYTFTFPLPPLPPPTVDSWTQKQVLTAFDAEVNDYYGGGVALSRDGRVMAVGAYGWETGSTQPGAGGVYIYDADRPIFTQSGATLYAADGAISDSYGRAVSVSEDGLVMVVGTCEWEGSVTDQGCVYTYDRVGSAWVQRGSVLVSSDTSAAHIGFGSSVALSGDGLVLMVGNNVTSGLFLQGALKTYSWNGSAWVPRGATIGPTSPSFSGLYANYIGDPCRTALNRDGSVFVLALREASGYDSWGAVYTHDWNGSAWVLRGTRMYPPLAVVSQGATSDHGFSGSIALTPDGNTMVVGYPGDPWIGAATVYVYDRNGSSWTLQSTITIPGGGASYENFGTAVAISADGKFLAVGHPGLIDPTAGGGVETYVWQDGVWKVSCTIHAPSDLQQSLQYGGSLSISTTTTGYQLHVGAEGSDIMLGRVYTYNVTLGWVVRGYIVSPAGEANDFAGLSVALNETGSVLAVGVPYKGSGIFIDMGAVYMYDSVAITSLSRLYTHGAWTIRNIVDSASNQQGSFSGFSCALSSSGDVLIIGIPKGEPGGGTHTDYGIVKTFDRNGSEWLQRGQSLMLPANVGAAFDYFGSGVAISSDGNTLVVGAGVKNGAVIQSQGSVYTYTRSGDIWSRKGSTLTISDLSDRTYFGWRIALSADGFTLLVSSIYGSVPGSGIGTVYMYRWIDGEWDAYGSPFLASDPVSDGLFGMGVAVSGDVSTVVIGASGRDTTLSNQGAVYLFEKN